MAKALVAASIFWPVVLASGTYVGIREQAPWLTGLAYLAGARVCHQLPARSFHTHGAKWPVCSRCSGLYLAAPVGALAALLRRRRSPADAPSVRWLVAAAVPTVVTFVLEHTGMAVVSSPARFAGALPLGAAVAWVIVRVARTAGAHRVN